ncbi:hypothetical protein A9Q87_07225 [Flavobacteriales bacterium 34_180_T64]|nr:hypothetical protein A9Q87_07225 [Flavobacteriales bacterium 34_180_T64]
MKNNYAIVLFLFMLFSTNLSKAQSCPPTGFSDTMSLFFFYDTGTSVCVDRPITISVDGSVFTLIDCADTYSVYDLTSGAPLSNPNMFLADFGFGTCEYTNGVLTDEVLSIDQIEVVFGNIKVFPNPLINSELLYIKFNAPLIAELNLFDVTGKQILRIKSDGEFAKTLDLNHLTNGMYFLQINSLGHAITKKIVVKR